MKILVAYDINNPKQKILEIGRQVAGTYSAGINIVTCLTAGENTRSYWEHKSTPVLEEAKKAMEEKGIVCEIFSLFSSQTPGECITDFALSNQVDLIIMGIRNRSKLDKLVFGSNAQHIILKAPCPVLSVPLG